MKRLTEIPHVGLLAAILLLFMALYLSRLTFSGLWFDEGIEYFYSKYLTGPVDVNPVDMTGSNMYERICLTFQPPLYNVLMFAWLSLFDSEAWFRLAGVLTTLVGGLGFYAAVRRMAGKSWGLAGMCFYLSTSAVIFYALECAEYNLMLAMECWMLYFFVSVCLSKPGRNRRRVMIGFYVFAVLAIYSQYGAAILIASLVLTLGIYYVTDKDYTSLADVLKQGMATFLLAIVPLVVFFLGEQMSVQGSAEVSHKPVFVGEFLWGIPYSLFKSFYEQVIWIFSTSLTWDALPFLTMRVIVFGAILCTFISLGFKRRLPVLSLAVMASLICYGLFFVLSACSLYAYNAWEGLVGCHSIIRHTRYILFFVPLLQLTLMAGVISFQRTVRRHCWRRIADGTLVTALTIFILYAVYGTLKGKIKADTREVTIAWIERNDSCHKVVVQEWEAGVFMYYCQHSPLYNESMKKNIILTGFDMRIPDKVEAHLQRLGIFELPEFYFVGKKHQAVRTDGEAMQLKDLFVRHGYHIDILSDGRSSLLYLSK